MDTTLSTVQQLKQRGRSLASQGKTAEAITVFQQITEQEPDQTANWIQLGTLYAMNGNFPKATECYEQAIQLAPDEAVSYYSLANVQKKTNQIDAAIENIYKAVKLNPKWDLAVNNLATTLQHSGRFEESAEVYENLLKLKPNDLNIMQQRRNVLIAARMVDEAIEACWQILNISPSHQETLAILGRLLQEDNRLDELLKYADFTEKVFPSHPNPKTIRAKVLARKGEWRKSQHILDSLLSKHHPSFEIAVAYTLIARAANAVPKAISIVLEVLDTASPKLPTEAQSKLHFCLGELYDCSTQYDDAFKHYHQGNALKFKGFDITTHEQRIDAIIKAFDKAYFEQAEKLQTSTDRPVFILGMPRSGTSLTEQILDCHSQIHAAGELTKISHLCEQTAVPSQQKRSFSEMLVGLKELPAAQLSEFSDQYLNHIGQLNSTSRYVTDKMPQNFLFLGLIARLFPNAHIIHCVRTPIDTSLSCYFQSFTHGHEYCYDLKTVGRYYRSYQKLMAHWKEALSIPIYTLEYETLISQPERTTKELIQFLDLSWEESCLKHHENPRAVATASNDQVRQPIYNRSKQRWKNYSNHIEELLEALKA